jgi:hypothetical protein
MPTSEKTGYGRNQALYSPLVIYVMRGVDGKATGQVMRQSDRHMKQAKVSSHNT